MGGVIFLIASVSVPFVLITFIGYAFDLLPQGYSYSGPDSYDASNLCYCNTVSYSLFSACGACQGQKWINWSLWVTNCTKILPPSLFPNPIPSGISVPRWASLDVTIENDWNASKSYAVGDTPEASGSSLISPSSIFGVSSSVLVSPTTSSSADSSGGSSSNAGTIAGGIIGVIVALIIIPAAVILYLRRRLKARAAMPADVIASHSQPPQSDEVAPSLSGSPITMKFYDPNDPTTFPGYQGDPHSQDIPSQVTMSRTLELETP
ncbi:hypothetical protein BJV77DRAFT_573141 [Russula vinacea]|nr:hypothetical protein BJV77DRAFT_573141 [Russula vinacea]